jgi:hypothetical protein
VQRESAILVSGGIGLRWLLDVRRASERGEANDGPSDGGSNRSLA